MTDPTKPRRKVTGLIPTTPTLSSPASNVVPRVRAKVDPSSIASSSSTSTPSARPSLRTTPSTASIRSHITTPITRSRSPAPPTTSTPHTPLPHVSASARAHSFPSPAPAGRPSRPTPGRSDSNTTPVARIKSAKTVIGSSGSVPPKNQHRVEDTAEGAVRARARALSLKSVHVDKLPPVIKGRPSASTSASVPLLQSPYPSTPLTSLASSNANPRLLSPHVGNDYPPGSPLSPSWRPHASPELIDDYPEAGPSSRRSSPTRRAPHIPTNAYAQHALAHVVQHPNATAPSSPILPAEPLPLPRSASREHPRGRPKLPYNPHSNNPPPLPPPPLSPELRSVALPSITPARTSEESSRADSTSRRFSGSGSELSSVLVELKIADDRLAEARLSGATAVESHADGDKEGEMDLVLGEDEEEAKINRKVADLEISNASLMAINRTLETTKAKQRSEILKLRRMLRESIGGAGTHPFLPVSTSTQSLISPLGLFSPSLEVNADEQADGYLDEEMADEQLDARWDKVAELVDAMRRRGEVAVERGREEVKVGPQRVLGWHEVEEEEGTGDQSMEVETPPNDDA